MTACAQSNFRFRCYRNPTPAAIGAALDMPAAEATKLLTRRQWHDGDVARLEAAAARLGVRVPEPWRPGG